MLRAGTKVQATVFEAFQTNLDLLERCCGQGIAV